MSSKNRKYCNPCSQERCSNERILSDTVIHCDSLIIRQDFCVNATVGVAPFPDGDDVTIQQFIENTIFQFTPGVLLSTDPTRLITVITRNLSNNFVNVAIQRSAPLNSDILPVTLVHATASPNSEVVLSAPNTNRLVASAKVPSQVQFFITVFHPTAPV